MKEIKLTRGMVALVDDADFDFLNQWKWFAWKSTHTFYARRTARVSDGRKRNGILMHRIISGANESEVCDHADGNGLNNQRQNLRKCTRLENRINARLVKPTQSNLRGVFPHHYKNTTTWEAHIKDGGKRKYLGIFKTKEEAAKVRDDYAKKIHGEFVSLSNNSIQHEK